MKPNKPTPLFWWVVRGFSGVVCLLLVLYLGNGLLNGDITYGVGGGGRMGRNNQVVHLDTPIELFFGILHFGSLAFAFGSLAASPAFFLRKPVLISTAVVFAVANLALVFFSLT